jgi:preprotein translocase SecE subunit
VARDRKRTRRGSRSHRPPGARVPPQHGAGGLGLPDDEPAGHTLDEEESWPTASSVFPQLGPFEGDPVTSTDAAAAAFGETARPLRSNERPQRDERASQGARVIGFLRGCWAELQRVQWPDRQQVVQATGVVLGFVVVAAVFLGIADEVSQQIVNAIL